MGVRCLRVDPQVPSAYPIAQDLSKSNLLRFVMSTGAEGERLKKAVLNAVSAFGKPEKRSDYVALYDVDCVIHDSPQGTLKGFEAIKQFYDSFWAAFPDAQLALENVIVEGDRFACTYTVTATHSGSAFNGIPASRKAIMITGVTILRLLESGKCIERWNGSDTLPLLQQLGATTSPK